MNPIDKKEEDINIEGCWRDRKKYNKLFILSLIGRLPLCKLLITEKNCDQKTDSLLSQWKRIRNEDEEVCEELSESDKFYEEGKEKGKTNLDEREEEREREYLQERKKKKAVRSS